MMTGLVYILVIEIQKKCEYKHVFLFYCLALLLFRLIIHIDNAIQIKVSHFGSSLVVSVAI